MHAHAKVDIVLETLPIISHMVDVDAAVDCMFKLLAGKSAETSGGLLVALPSEAAAAAYIADITATDGRPAWVVGRVVSGTGTARIAEGVSIVAV